MEVDSSEEGRITGAHKQLLDQRVHEMLSEDVEAPPPPYSPPEIKSTALSPNSLSGEAPVVGSELSCVGSNY